MEGPFPNSYLPLFTKARVDAHDVSHHSLWCSVPSGQQLGTPVKVLTRGNNDLYRINQDPLPVVGTWGLVALVGGDTRAAFWMGAYTPSENNAVLTGGIEGPGEPAHPSIYDTDSQYEYNAYWSGTYTVLDPFGNYFVKFVDGSYILIGESDTPPTMYRYAVGKGLSQILTSPISDASRIPNISTHLGTLPPPSKFYVDLNHPTGARFLVRPDGEITIFSRVTDTGGGPASSTIDVAPDGTITINALLSTSTNPYKIEVDPDGTITLFGPNFSKVLMDVNGNITLTTTGGSEIDVNENGSIELTTLEGNNVTLDNAGNISIHAPDIVTITSNTYVHIKSPTIYLDGDVVSGGGPP